MTFHILVAYMKPGQTAYTQPWALTFDSEQYPFLGVRFPAYSQISERPEDYLKIERFGEGSADFKVCSQCPNSHKFWKPEKSQYSDPYLMVRLADENVDIQGDGMDFLLVFAARRRMALQGK